MINREITVYVCGNSIFSLDYWTKRFEKFFGGATTVQAFGTWEGDSEPTNLVSHLYNKQDPDFKRFEFNNLAYEYKREAKQQVVMVSEIEVKTKLY